MELVERKRCSSIVIHICKLNVYDESGKISLICWSSSIFNPATTACNVWMYNQINKSYIWSMPQYGLVHLSNVQIHCDIISFLLYIHLRYGLNWRNAANFSKNSPFEAWNVINLLFCKCDSQTSSNTGAR